MESKTLYIAYGSNLNLRQMSFRCPTAKIVGASEIKDYELLFRGGNHGSVATVEPFKGGHVPILLWLLRENDLKTLDQYEGFPHFYRKEILDVELECKPIPAMVYIMNDGHLLGSPSDFYLNTIMEGYKSAGFDTDILDQAVEKSIHLAAEQQPEQENFYDLKWW
jgi:hypothetical protein